MGGFWPFGVLGCFIPLWLIVIAAECVRVLWFTLATPSKPARPSCGKCGYTVEGLPTGSCPECGSTFGRVGVDTRFLALRHRGNLVAAIIAWTTLILGTAALVTMFFGFRATRAAIGPGAATKQVWTTPLIPKSKGYSTVDLVSTTSAASGSYVVDSIDLKLTLNDQTWWTLKYNGSAGNYLVEDSSGTLIVPLTPLSAGGPSGALFGAAGLDITKPATGAEVAELDRIVSILIMSPFTQPSQMTLSQFVAGSPTFSGSMVPGTSFSDWLPAVLSAAAAFVVWLLGIWWIVMRRRRVLARCAG